METASIVENISIINPQLAKMLDKIFEKNKINPEEEGGAHLAKQDESTDSD